MIRPALVLALCGFSVSVFAQTSPPERPKAGKPEIFKEADLKPGMKGYAWTVFSGTEPEPVPIEILGVEKNMWGPRQDVIVARMGGKAERTNVAGGMSGSPVYIDGKLVGAIALRLSVFSPDAICGITPIELMLEVNSMDKSKPTDASLPGGVSAAKPPAAGSLNFVPIATPLSFSGFSQRAIQQFAPAFENLGMPTVAGGSSNTLREAKPAPGWQNSLQPGDAVSVALVSGDMSVSGMCTVTYNDGSHILACGHSFFNLGAVDMPMAKTDVLTTLASSYQPNKMGNATEIVGALRQDRHSAILGELGATAAVVPVNVHVRSLDSNNRVQSEKDLSFSIFVQQKWTPYLMMLTLFNAISSQNEFADQSTYRLSGEIELDGQPNLNLSTMQAPGELPVPAPMLLASWWGERFNRLFLNPVETPRLKAVNATVDLLPDRRTATVETGWISESDAQAGSVVTGKVFLRPYRGERIERDFSVKLPAGLAKGQYDILLSDADTLNRFQSAAGKADQFINIPQTISLLNQERSNSNLYISLVEKKPTVFYEDKSLPNLPPSVINVMQTGRSASRSLPSSGESVMEQGSIPFNLVVSGSYSLKISVK
ncbi:MAG TPA: hypothetical protein VHD76_07845 [Bryobacteraceae bacterium]|jgi:hypothetical protein|nr:hypothetical protein [Bryobacteraceae bacterium]